MSAAVIAKRQALQQWYGSPAQQQQHAAVVQNQHIYNQAVGVAQSVYQGGAGQTAPAVQWNTGFGSATISTSTFVVVGGGSGIVGGSGVINDYSHYPNYPQPNALQRGVTYDMPNGSKVIVAADGSYTIDDKDAKVIYRASRVRDFNPFMNASDLLERYIEELEPQGVKQDEVLHLEIEHFIYWLVCKASERDGDAFPSDLPTPPDARLMALAQRCPRCKACGRFIRRAWAAASIAFCSPLHMERAMARIA